MQVVRLETVPLIERPHIREGVFRSRRILNGTPGTPGNFSLQLSAAPNYDSPRHRHNFDQVRYQLEGDFDFAADGVMKAGMVGYFPEGTYYGPQSSAAENSTLVLQFGGASGFGYISPEQYGAASAELAKRGTFAKGVYTRTNPDGAKVNKDAYEAVWEQVNGRLLVYPKQRYLRPVFMEPESFEWVALEEGLPGRRQGEPGRTGQPGASCKQLGEFSERHTQIAFLRINPGSTLDLEHNSIYFVTAGTGGVSLSESADETKHFERHTTIYLDLGDHATLSASGNSPAELLRIGLPHLNS